MLDIGCSFGYVIEAGRRLGLESSGSDISEYAVRTCRERGLSAELGTLEAQPFASGAFDIVIMQHVLEHTPQPKRALAEVRRLLTPTGHVVIAVPNLRYWKGLFQRRSYRYFRPDDLGQQHYVYYTSETLARLLTNSGFDVLATSKAIFRPLVAARGRPAAVLEGLRYAGLWLWQFLAEALLSRREVFVVARRQ